MPELFGNNYTNIGTTENPIYRSNSSFSSGGGGEIVSSGGGGEIVFCRFGLWGTENQLNNLTSSINDQATGMEVDPAKTYKFLSAEYSRYLDGRSTMNYFVVGAEPAVISLDTTIESSTFLGRGTIADGATGYFWTYIYNNEIKIIVTSYAYRMTGDGNEIDAAFYVT